MQPGEIRAEGQRARIVDKMKMGISLERVRGEKAKTGIYCIKNLLNSKVYVGSAIQIHKRIILHRAALRGNRHVNIHLQRAFNLYGDEGFSVAILEITEHGNLIEREQYWIDHLNAVKHGYNIEPVAGRAAFAEETRKKISASAKARWKTDSKQRARFAALLERNRSPAGRKRISERRIGKTWSDEARASASEKMKKNERVLSLCKRNGAAKKGSKRPHDEVEKIRLNAFGRKPVEQFSVDGKLLQTYTSVRHVKRIHGFAPSHIIDCCKGRIATAYGHVWKYGATF